MVQIDRPLLPPRFYRYRSIKDDKFEQELAAIVSNYLWCSNYRALNDPMEGFYRTSPWVARQSNFERLSSEIADGKRSVGICCFSDTHENDLMWAHYAENYKGFCVAYSTNDLQSALSDDVRIVRVAYNDEPPRINKEISQNAQESVRVILSHKKTPWLYEKEWRLLVNEKALRRSPPGPLSLSTKQVAKAIFLGSRVEKSEKDQILQMLSGTKIKLYEMEVSKYQHNWKLFK